MLRRALADLPTSATDSATGKFSLAGAQAKIALHRTVGGWSDPSGAVPSTHIVKPAIPRCQIRTSSRWSRCGRLRAGVARGPVRHRALRRRTRHRHRTIRPRRAARYRVDAGSGDMCQALRVAPFRKYESQGGPGAIGSPTSSAGSATFGADSSALRSSVGLPTGWCAAPTPMPGTIRF